MSDCPNWCSGQHDPSNGYENTSHSETVSFLKVDVKGFRKTRLLNTQGTNGYLLVGDLGEQWVVQELGESFEEWWDRAERVIEDYQRDVFEGGVDE